MTKAQKTKNIYNELDTLIDDAIELCKEVDIICPSMLQHELGTGFVRAQRLFIQLEELGIICERDYIDSEYGQILAGKVDKKKIKELSLN